MVALKNSLKKIIILGAVGNCIDILDSINEINLIEKQYECIGFLDDNKELQNTVIHGVKVLGALCDAKMYKDAFFINGIGSPMNFWLKKQIIAKTKIKSDRFATIIHPTASISKMSNIGRGCVILQNVTICSNVTIGDHTIILPNSTINHDDIIASYVTIASGVNISGDVIVSENVYIGSNSSIIGGIEIANNALVGMGSVVLKNIQSNSVVVGNPAVYLRALK